MEQRHLNGKHWGNTLPDLSTAVTDLDSSRSLSQGLRSLACGVDIKPGSDLGFV